jgi:hypothetical protein
MTMIDVSIRQRVRAAAEGDAGSLHSLEDRVELRVVDVERVVVAAASLSWAGTMVWSRTIAMKRS